MGLVKTGRLEVQKAKKWKDKQEERLSRDLLYSYTILNFDISLEMAAFGKILKPKLV
jgi:hypothetical protein